MVGPRSFEERLMAKEQALESQPKWQQLKYPDEDTFIRVAIDYPDLDGKDFYELPAFLRLGWPSEDLWNRCARTEERERAREQKQREPGPWPVARRPWS